MRCHISKNSTLVILTTTFLGQILSLHTLFALIINISISQINSVTTMKSLQKKSLIIKQQP